MLSLSFSVLPKIKLKKREHRVTAIFFRASLKYTPEMTIARFHMNKITKELSETALKKILHGITIPSPPQIIVDLQIELALPDINLIEIERIILKDVGISGKVIKLVNSPFFGLRNHITSVQQALSLLGIKTINNLVQSIAITESFADKQFIEMTRFWDNAMDVAKVAVSLSRRMGIAAPNEAYTLGLFHNSGIALLLEKYSNYPEVIKAAYAEKKLRITDIENNYINSNHAVVGYYIAKSWKLPVHISEAIADHHKTLPIFNKNIPCNLRKKNLLAILKLAENICKTHQYIGYEDNDYEFDRVKEGLFFYLDISEYEYNCLKEDILDEIIIN